MSVDKYSQFIAKQQDLLSRSTVNTVPNREEIEESKRVRPAVPSDMIGKKGAYTSKGGETPAGLKKDIAAAKAKTNEEVEQIDESQLKAGKMANDIYRKHRAGEISDSEASKALDKLVPHMSTSQYYKHLDFSYGVRHNPNFYQKNKPTNEEAEQIDELSSETLASYAIKSKRYADRAATWSGKDAAEYTNKRRRGVKKAIDKLTDIAMSKKLEESDQLDEAMIKQGSKEHLQKLKDMLDKAKPGSADHSQIRGAIESKFGKQHIPAKHRNVKPDVYEGVEQIDEIGDTEKGRAALRRYKDQAAREIDAGGYDQDDQDDNDAAMKVANRETGWERAHKILNKKTPKTKTNEEAEQIDETSIAYKNKYLKKAWKWEDKQFNNFMKGKPRASEEKQTDRKFHMDRAAVGTWKQKVALDRAKNSAMGKANEEAEQIEEKLGKDAPAGEWIHDFVKSKNPKFAGKSKEERRKQALAAYYAKKKED